MFVGRERMEGRGELGENDQRRTKAAKREVWEAEAQALALHTSDLSPGSRRNQEIRGTGLGQSQGREDSRVFLRRRETIGQQGFVR